MICSRILRLSIGFDKFFLHTYSHDALGRVSARTQTRGSAAARSDSFGYNARSELASATLGSDAYAYAFDYIGNRSTATEAETQFAYTTNELNQYTSRGEAAFLPLPENPSESDSEQSDRNVASPLTFSPTYDADGNATLVRTSTGTWSISYNGENRPIRFENAATQTVLECAYDSQGRRFEKKVTVAGTLTLHERYVYDGYLQIAAFDVSTDAAGTESFALKRVIFWDPEEPTATRPLAINVLGDNLYFPTVDLTKNVCELVDFYGDVAATYDYAPFGAVSAGTPSGSAVPANPFQWSSEVYDSELDLVYYNYRHYSPADGRFLSRDPIEEEGGLNLYAFVKNNALKNVDLWGRAAFPIIIYGPDDDVDKDSTCCLERRYTWKHAGYKSVSHCISDCMSLVVSIASIGVDATAIKYPNNPILMPVAAFFTGYSVGSLGLCTFLCATRECVAFKAPEEYTAYEAESPYICGFIPRPGYNPRNISCKTKWRCPKVKES